MYGSLTHGVGHKASNLYLKLPLNTWSYVTTCHQRTLDRGSGSWSQEGDQCLGIEHRCTHLERLERL